MPCRPPNHLHIICCVCVCACVLSCDVQNYSCARVCRLLEVRPMPNAACCVLPFWHRSCAPYIIHIIHHILYTRHMFGMASHSLPSTLSWRVLSIMRQLISSPASGAAAASRRRTSYLIHDVAPACVCYVCYVGTPFGNGVNVCVVEFSIIAVGCPWPTAKRFVHDGNIYGTQIQSM